MKTRFTLVFDDTEMVEIDTMRAKLGLNRTVFLRTATKQFIAHLQAGKPLLLYNPPPDPKVFKPRAETDEEKYARNAAYHAEFKAKGMVLVMARTGNTALYMTPADATADGAVPTPNDPGGSWGYPKDAASDPTGASFEPEWGESIASMIARGGHAYVVAQAPPDWQQYQHLSIAKAWLEHNIAGDDPTM